MRAKGAAYVECPVSGSVIPARTGKLLGLMGAEPADAARARPILDQFAAGCMHAGPVGGGALLKLAVNLPLMVYWQALGEQLALCKPLPSIRRTCWISSPRPPAPPPCSSSACRASSRG